MEPMVLCVGMTPDKNMRLSIAAMKLGIRIRPVKEEEWGQPLSALCGLDGQKKSLAKVTVGEEMMVMAFFPDPLMDQWLAVLRQNGLTVRLKAVLTEHNRSWDCGRLYAALSQEAAFMMRKGR